MRNFGHKIKVCNLICFHVVVFLFHSIFLFRLFYSFSSFCWVVFLLSKEHSSNIESNSLELIYFLIFSFLFFSVYVLAKWNLLFTSHKSSHIKMSMKLWKGVSRIYCDSSNRCNYLLCYMARSSKKEKNSNSLEWRSDFSAYKRYWKIKLSFWIVGTEFSFMRMLFDTFITIYVFICCSHLIFYNNSVFVTCRHSENGKQLNQKFCVHCKIAFSFATHIEKRKKNKI